VPGPARCPTLRREEAGSRVPTSRAVAGNASPTAVWILVLDHCLRVALRGVGVFAFSSCAVTFTACNQCSRVNRAAHRPPASKTPSTLARAGDSASVRRSRARAVRSARSSRAALRSAPHALEVRDDVHFSARAQGLAGIRPDPSCVSFFFGAPPPKSFERDRFPVTLSVPPIGAEYRATVPAVVTDP
jgi:hypothetical protein